MQRFENYLSMRGVLTDKAVCHQILINSIGPKHFMLMVSLVAPQKISDVEYDVLVRKLETHLCPKKNVFVLQHRFLSTYQGEGQTLSEYVAMLRRDLNECEFVSTCDCKADISNIFLQAQFIRGLKDGHIREQLLQSEEPDFNKILEKAVSLEASRIDSRELESKNSATSDVNKVRSRSSNRNGRQKFQRSSSRSSTSSKTKNSLHISLDNGSTIDVRLVTNQGRCSTTKPETESARQYSRLETPSPTLSSSSTYSTTSGTLQQTSTKANLVNEEHTYFCNPELKEEMEALENKLTARIVLQNCTAGHSLRRFFPDDPHMENAPLMPLNPPQNDYNFDLSQDEGICELYDIPCCP
uniref:Retrotransposon gag domain-containing protein n=1 Tax=Musca domestica TaxID=7370 RepID=A0A1I8NJP5_MUSDO